MHFHSLATSSTVHNIILIANAYMYIISIHVEVYIISIHVSMQFSSMLDHHYQYHYIHVVVTIMGSLCCCATHRFPYKPYFATISSKFSTCADSGNKAPSSKRAWVRGYGHSGSPLPFLVAQQFFSL